MKLADKPCYPVITQSMQDRQDERDHYYSSNEGLTFRERLIIALASNADMVKAGRNINAEQCIREHIVAKEIISQADMIITELEKEKKND